MVEFQSSREIIFGVDSFLTLFILYKKVAATYCPLKKDYPQVGDSEYGDTSRVKPESSDLQTKMALE